ncbi:MAG: hypothetical protein KDA96_01200 [Planctomycetaceae bacterium]|nr:hypothetical protein [Planctomycetaceae bacterium]
MKTDPRILLHNKVIGFNIRELPAPNVIPPRILVIPRGFPPVLTALLRDSADACVAARYPDDVEDLCARGFRELLLLFPIQEHHRLQVLQTAARHSLKRLIVPVDHYAHLEVLSEVAMQCDCQIECLINSDLTGRAGGVRPGHDSSRLLHALTSLPGVHPGGFLINLRSLESDSAQCQPTAVTLVQLQEVMKNARSAVRYTLEMARNVASLPPELPSYWRLPVSATTSADGLGNLFGNPLRTDGDFLISETFLFRLRTTRDGDLGDGRLRRTFPAISFQSHVVSRPSLDRAVVDNPLRLSTEQSRLATVSLPDGASIELVDDEVIVLHLTGAARDLIIGAVVEFSVASWLPVFDALPWSVTD